MTTTIWIGTRKGLFVARQSGAAWKIIDSAFAGVPVTMLLAEPASNRVYAALDHGHFGVKLHRSENGGRDWQEISAPTYPDKPEGVVDLDPMRHSEIPWDTKMIWSLESGGREGELWCGTIPGGLFRSSDCGDSWQLVESLWNDPLRKQWFGGGADLPGIHSIAVHPGDPDRVYPGQVGAAAEPLLAQRIVPQRLDQLPAVAEIGRAKQAPRHRAAP